MVSARSIVQGAYYAMEQAGLLLADAAMLYSQQKWSSSLVLAVFSLEELGKAEMLLQRAADAARTGPKSIEDVMAGVNHHNTKLTAGQGALTITASVGFWGDIPLPGSTGAAELERQLDRVQQIALAHAPRATHQARMRALYVDLGDYMWNRPVETSSDEAYPMVAKASIEYGVRRGKLVNPADPDVRQAVDDLGGLIPQLPEAPEINWPD